MPRSYERCIYILAICFLIMYISFPWRGMDPQSVKFAAVTKIYDLTDMYGNLQVDINRVDKKSGGIFTVTGNTQGAKSVIGVEGLRENVTTSIRYEVDLDFWCTTLPETCANYRSVKLVGEKQRVPAL